MDRELRQMPVIVLMDKETSTDHPMIRQWFEDSRFSPLKRRTSLRRSKRSRTLPSNAVPTSFLLMLIHAKRTCRSFVI